VKRLTQKNLGFFIALLLSASKLLLIFPCGKINREENMSKQPLEEPVLVLLVFAVVVREGIGEKKMSLSVSRP
jgi:hypothetical protein